MLFTFFAVFLRNIFFKTTLMMVAVTTFGIVYSLIFTAAALVLGVVLFSRIEKTFMDTV